MGKKIHEVACSDCGVMGDWLKYRNNVFLCPSCKYERIIVETEEQWKRT